MLNTIEQNLIGAQGIVNAKGGTLTQAYGNDAIINAKGGRAPAPVVAPITPPEPTVGETLQGIKTQAMTIQDQVNQMKAAEGAAFQAPTLSTNNVPDPTLNPINERAIQRNQLKLFQAEIDATNKVYDQLYNQKVLEGTGRLGTQRAQAARGGLLGSDFGSAQQEKVMSYNTAEEQAVQAERQTKIGAIMGKVRTAVADEIAAKRLARTQDADAYLKYLTSRDETRAKNTQNIAESFLAQGIDPTTLSPDEMKAITGDSGISAADIINNYRAIKQTQDAAAAETDLKTRKTEAEISKINSDVENAGFFNLSEGQSRYDANGNVIASKGKTYAPGTGSKGGVPEVIATTVRDRLESLRGQDTYTDTKKYLDEYSSYVEAGGAPEEFLKSFDPNKYINPADPTRGWLESQMKKASEVDPLDQLIAGVLAEALVPQE